MKTIVVVEDERHTAELLQHALETQGYKVECAHTGTAGIEKIKAVKPSLIFLDIGLPGMDGWSVLEILKSSEKLKDIPVLMCTAENQMSDIEKADKFGVSGYITKPIRISRVVEKVKEIL